MFSGHRMTSTQNENANDLTPLLPAGRGVRRHAEDHAEYSGNTGISAVYNENVALCSSRDRNDYLMDTRANRRDKRIAPGNCS